MTGTFLSSLNFWHWFIFGIVLIVVEMLAPGAVFLWLGVAAIGTGLIVAVASGFTWEFQIVVFAILAGASIYLGRRFVSNRPAPSDHPALNRRGAQYVGRVYVLDWAIQHGEGKLIIDDTTWRIIGPDAAAGVPVRVLGLDGNSLRVEPI